MSVRSLPFTSIMSSSVSAPGPIPLLIAQLESSSSHSLSSAHRPLPANSRRVAHVSRGGLAPPPSSSVEVLYGRHLSAVGDPHVVVPANGDSQLPSLAEGSLRASLAPVISSIVRFSYATSCPVACFVRAGLHPSGTCPFRVRLTLFRREITHRSC